MYSPVHATAGLYIAALVPDPLIGLPLAVASHYMLDAIPHGDTGLGPWMTADGKRHRILTVEGIDLGSAALMVSWLVIMHPNIAPWYLIAGAIGGILPDLLWGTSFVFSKFLPPIPVITPLLHWHDRVHSWGHAKVEDDVPYRVGLIYQGLLLAVVLMLRL